MDRKEFEYQDQIEMLGSSIEDIGNIMELTKSHILEIQRHSMENQKNKMILQLKNETLDDMML